MPLDQRQFRHSGVLVAGKIRSSYSGSSMELNNSRFLYFCHLQYTTLVTSLTELFTTVYYCFYLCRLPKTWGRTGRWERSVVFNFLKNGPIRPPHPSPVTLQLLNFTFIYYISNYFAATNKFKGKHTANWIKLNKSQSNKMVAMNACDKSQTH